MVIFKKYFLSVFETLRSKPHVNKNLDKKQLKNSFSIRAHSLGLNGAEDCKSLLGSFEDKVNEKYSTAISERRGSLASINAEIDSIVKNLKENPLEDRAKLAFNNFQEQLALETDLVVKRFSITEYNISELKCDINNLVSTRRQVEIDKYDNNPPVKQSPLFDTDRGLASLVLIITTVESPFIADPIISLDLFAINGISWFIAILISLIIGLLAKSFGESFNTRNYRISALSTLLILGLLSLVMVIRIDSGHDNLFILTVFNFIFALLAMLWGVRAYLHRYYFQLGDQIKKSKKELAEEEKTLSVYRSEINNLRNKFQAWSIQIASDSIAEDKSKIDQLEDLKAKEQSLILKLENEAETLIESGKNLILSSFKAGLLALKNRGRGFQGATTIILIIGMLLTSCSSNQDTHGYTFILDESISVHTERIPDPAAIVDYFRDDLNVDKTRANSMKVTYTLTTIGDTPIRPEVKNEIIIPPYLIRNEIGFEKELSIFLATFEESVSSMFDNPNKRNDNSTFAYSVLAKHLNKNLPAGQPHKVVIFSDLIEESPFIDMTKIEYGPDGFQNEQYEMIKSALLSENDLNIHSGTEILIVYDPDPEFVFQYLTVKKFWERFIEEHNGKITFSANL